ncbi:IS4 family transposase [Flavobacterium franklandianum]|uniref:IS4 family transposase n=1 Tax=Flavobacterium bomense TaxID=2497483 RepID=A0A432CDN0_9FLAO|nr:MULTISPECIES: IS4 family transposase [Flavobacterium]RTZ00373.1 IS4 family transposase [Flavobacterium bomense]TRX20562.1 IS4 family transposase [Flavobacterium franklandianum]
MNSGKYIFSQLLDFVNRYEFEKIVKKYNGNYRVRELNCWNQFIQLFFGQLTNLNSLRDICLCLKAHNNKLYHLGIKNYVSHTTLSRANEKRDWQIFSDFGNHLIELVRPLYKSSEIPNLSIDNELYALDSTTISCSINLLTWAEGKYSRGAVKMHTLLDLRGSIPSYILVTDGKYHDSNVLDQIIPEPDAIYIMDKAYVDFKALYRINTFESYFVTRAKSSLKYTIIEQNFNIDESTGLRADKIIELTIAKSKKLYPEKLRLIEYYDADKNNYLVFMTNNFDVTALEVSYIYKNRWQIETFFKWIKQNLVIKKLWGHSQNAVKIHIWTAICTYLIVAYVKKVVESELSIYQIMQILSISAFDKTPVGELLGNFQNNQNINEQQYNIFDN